MFYRRHTVPVTSCREVKYVLKGVKFYGKCLPINDSKLDDGLYNAFLCLINSHSQVSNPGPEGPLVTSLVRLNLNLGRPTLKADALPAELSNITVLKTLPNESEWNTPHYTTLYQNSYTMMIFKNKLF